MNSTLRRQLSTAAMTGVIVLLASGAAQALPSITVQSGGISLNSTNTGTAGSSGDPWLIDENMTSPGTLIFQGDGQVGPLGDANATTTGHDAGRWIQKTILNDTGVDWTSFELELQVSLGTPSGQGDGLSFADGSLITGSFSSNVFSTYTRIDVTRDYLNFHGGTVADGSSVTFLFAITDNSRNDPFYLLQTPNVRDVLPEPASFTIIGLGLAGLVLVRRKRAA